MDDPKPGAVIAVQTFGDFLNFNPHLHIIATDGCFDQDGGFMVGTVPDASLLEELFRLQVLGMLKKAGKINDAIRNRELSEVRHIKKVLLGERELTLDNFIGRNCGQLATMGK